MTIKLRSHLKKHIVGFLRQKRALGYVYASEERTLEQFDSLCAEYYPSETILTKSMALKWAEARENESVKSTRNRIIPIRELAKYMNGIGAEAYLVPQDLLPHVTRYMPYVYTPEELATVFSFFDTIPRRNKFPVRHLVIPVMFRLIYCCGLRPKEGREILRNDINLRTGQAVIQKTKNHKDRIIVLSPDVLKLCQQYDKKVNDIFPERRYFFPNSNGNAYSREWMLGLFRKCLNDSKLPFRGQRHDIVFALFEFLSRTRKIFIYRILYPSCSTILFANIRHVPRKILTLDS